MSIGANIKAKRQALGMTQKELADKVNVDQSMVCQLERCTKVPSLPLGMEIAAALGCDVRELVNDMARAMEKPE